MPRAKKTAKSVYYGTGRRKCSVAKVRVMAGQGTIVINGKQISDYFGRKVLELTARQPLSLTATEDKYDIFVSVHGGGIAGQAGAVRH